MSITDQDLKDLNSQGSHIESEENILVAQKKGNSSKKVEDLEVKDAQLIFQTI